VCFYAGPQDGFKWFTGSEQVQMGLTGIEESTGSEEAHPHGLKKDTSLKSFTGLEEFHGFRKVPQG